MDAAILDVRRLFELRLSELDVLETKLNKSVLTKFSNRDSSSSPNGLFERLQVIAKAIPTLFDQLDNVTNQKEEVRDTLTRLLQSNTAQLHRLQAKCNVAVDKECEHELPELITTTFLVSNAVGEVDEEAEPAPVQFGVSAETFEGVSDTVRGRTPLHEVNALYGAIFAHFEKDPKSAPLTTQQLGAKASGLKAKNAIHTLRHLKLIEVTKDGISLPRTCANKRKSRA